jgi:D-3-phosphoglycerate dehydrogenase
MTPNKRVIHLDTNHPKLWEGLEALGYENVAAFDWSKSEILDCIQEFDGLVIRSRIPIDAHLLSGATRLKWLARVGAGMENIDTEFARLQGIACLNAPEGNRDALAEHALGMLLTLSNNLIRADREVRSGIWLREANRGFEIRGLTLGIVGYGQMGSAFGELAAAVGLRVLAYDKYKQVGQRPNIESVSESRLLEEADILSLHLPLTDETKYYVDENYLNRFRKKIILINTARGIHVDTKALLNGLDSGRVQGACLDVLEYEKAHFENLFDGRVIPEPLRRLLEHDRVVLSPHIAGWSHESALKMAEVILQKVAAL